MTHTTIFHNPQCGTSRNALGLIRNAGIEPVIVEYLKTPPSRDTLIALAARAGQPLRHFVREQAEPYKTLGLADPTLTDDQLLDAMQAHPVLINRPIVATAEGVRLCRPCEQVLDILPQPQRGEFVKENGDKVVDANGQRIA